MDIKFFLKNLPAFEDFKSDHLEVLAQGLKIEDYPEGHAFIQQGTQGDALYLVISGSIRIMRHDGSGGGEYEAREMSAGELFGILSLVDNLPASATCIAKGSVKAASLSRDSFLKLFQNASPIGHHLQYMIAVQMARDIQEENKSFRAALAGR
jgi:CRP/FNR family cyclic AMP-dependent transcriptional regulator